MANQHPATIDGHLEGLSPREVATDLLARVRETGARYWSWVAILAVLSGLGIVGLLIRLSGGFDSEDRPGYGYLAATVAYLTTVFMGAPLVAAGQRFVKSQWRRPITRVAELWGLVGMLALLLILPALAALPTHIGRTTIWFDWQSFAPFGWDTVSMATMALVGLTFLWSAALPDLAAIRDHLPRSRRQRLVAVLSLGWKGNVRQWRVLYPAILILGAFYLMLYPLIQTLVSSDLSAGLLPGLKDAIYPAFQTLQGLQAGIAVTLVTMFVLRRTGGYGRYIGTDQFWALSKPLLATSLLWFYFWWATFLTFWYGRQPSELALIDLIMFGTYRIPFLMAFFLNFLIPVVGLIWNPVRRSVWGPTLIGLSILIGTFFNQVRMYVSAYSIPDSELGHHALGAIPAGQLPQVPDVLIAMGAVSGAVLLFMLASKLVSPVAIWEVGEGLHLSRVRPFLATHLRVIARSR